MKNLNLLSVLLTCLFVTSLSASAIGLRSEFKNYEVEAIDDLNLGRKVKAVWTLSYSNEEVPVTVVKHKTWEGTEYVVSSKYFAVSYASTANGFGVKETRRAWSSVHKKITEAVVNQEEMKRQQIITPNEVDDEKALGLIAGFLPMLVNDGYTHVLN